MRAIDGPESLVQEFADGSLDEIVQEGIDENESCDIVGLADGKLRHLLGDWPRLLRDEHHILAPSNEDLRRVVATPDDRGNPVAVLDHRADPRQFLEKVASRCPADQTGAKVQLARGATRFPDSVDRDKRIPGISELSEDRNEPHHNLTGQLRDSRFFNEIAEDRPLIKTNEVDQGERLVADDSHDELKGRHAAVHTPATDSISDPGDLVVNEASFDSQKDQASNLLADSQRRRYLAWTCNAGRISLWDFENALLAGERQPPVVILPR